MKLPRFTLRRAPIAIAFLALFLEWLRPDRADIIRYGDYGTAIVFRPLFYPGGIMIRRLVEPQGVEWTVGRLPTLLPE